MERKQNLHLKPQLSTTISPHLYQYLKLLQMNQAELDVHIQELFEANPLLEFDNESQRPPSQIEFEFADYPERFYSSANCPDQDSPDPLALLSAPQGESLYDSLRIQLDELNIDAQQRKLVLFLISDLDENGYLSHSILTTLAKRYHSSPAENEKALCLLQSLEPAGIGARSLSECLCLQLNRFFPEEKLALKVATEYLEELGKSHFRKIAKELSASADAVQHAADIIRQLEPKPAARYCASENARYIRPDIIVTRENNKLIISLRNSRLGSLCLSSQYTDMLHSTEDPELKGYLSRQLQVAQSIMGSIEVRTSTILNCAQLIVEHQAAFFLGNESCPKPYTQHSLAQTLGVSPSTVSRAVSGKYLQCDRGVFPLSYFFPSPVDCRDPVNASSSADVMEIIRSMSENETRSKPLSDSELLEELKKIGINISRRSIANYRSRLGIPNAAQRKKANEKKYP